MQLLFFTLVILSLARASDVVDVTPETIDGILNNKDTHVLLEVYAPWCGHCKSLAPEYELAGTAFAKIDSVVVAKVDADAHGALAERFEVKGFPTLLYFKPGQSTEPEKYQGPRTADGIVEFLNGKAGTSAMIKKAASSVITLDAKNFDSHIPSSAKGFLVEFYAPWCGHCKSLAPKWDQLGNIYAGDDAIAIAKVDADAEKSLGSKFGVTGFPTIKFFPAGASEPIEYEGGRDIADFIKFLNEHATHKRDDTGKLEASAGRIAELDEVVRQFTAGALKNLRVELDKAAASLKDAQKATLDFYKRVAAKYETEGRDFITKQQARMGRLLESASIAPAKLDELVRKLNIINIFAGESEE